MNKENLIEATVKALLESNEGPDINLNDEGLPVLEKPYRMSERNDERLQITSSHPYDNTEYCWAISADEFYTGSWQIIDNGKVVDAAIGYEKAVEIMKEIDSKKEAKIDRT